MFIVWGSGLYGKTDEIPGMGHVATKFGHLYYFPLIPTGSQFIVSKDGNTWHGAPVGLSGKSILLAWLRAGLLVASVIAVLLTGAFAMDNRPQWDQVGIFGAAAVFFIGALIATNVMKVFKQASYERAKQIADTTGFSDEARVLVDLVYGMITEQEAERRYDSLGEDGENVFDGNEQFAAHDLAN